MARFIIHCGAHKTGSTLIQKGLEKHSDDIKRQGLVYIPHKIIYHNIVQKMQEIDSTRISTIKSFFDQIIGSYHPLSSFLISHEGMFAPAYHHKVSKDKQFFPGFEDRLRILIDTLSGHDVNLIFYIRRQDTFIESIYLEGFQRGYVRSNFNDFFSEINTCGVSWLKLIRTMEQYVPKDHLTIKPFEEIKKGSVVYLRSFLEIFCDPGEMDLRPIEGARRSLSAPAYFFVRLLQNVIPYSTKSGLKLHQIIVYIVLKIMSNRYFSRMHFMDQNQKNEILDYYKDDNEVLFREYLPDLPLYYYSKK